MRRRPSPPRAKTPRLPTAALAGLIALALPAAAEPAKPTPSETATVTPEALAERRKAITAELEQIASEIKVGSERQQALRREIEALEKDRARIAADLVATAGRVQKLEADATATERRIQKIEADTVRARASLATRRELLAGVLAALQRIGRRPPPAIAVRPEDALASVRSAILLGAVLPEVRGEAEKLAVDLAEMVRLRDRAAAERDAFRGDLAALSDERQRLELLVEERRTHRSESQKKLDEERRRAAELALKADGLKDLIGRVEGEIESARKAAEAARAAEAAARAAPPPPRDPKAQVAALGDPTRIEPAIPFAETRGRLAWPARGAKLKDFGEDDGLGGTARGLTIATRPEARVTSPADGWVVYAGPFRSYGQLLIINAGGGYHLVLAGMERIDVELGQFVLSGEPVGVMGAGPAGTAPRSGSTEGPARTANRSAPRDVDVSKTGSAALYVELRKDGAAIDPTPWWAPGANEAPPGSAGEDGKVRG